jgi:orotidine-5'-phosphate decarboxylase
VTARRAANDAPAAKPRVIVALDVADAASATSLVRALRPAIDYFKIGSQLFTAAGPPVVDIVRSAGADVFLDLKFHDIPETVGRAAAAAARLGVRMLNVHALGGAEMMRRAAGDARDAATAAGWTAPDVIAVTLLTSADEASLSPIGLAGSAADVVIRLARLSRDAGMDGVVASMHEVAAVRGACGPDFLAVVPGIRPEGAARDDQVRIATPGAAAAAGATHLVVGRPVTRAADPLGAAHAILKQL